MKNIKSGNPISHKKWCVYSHYDSGNAIQAYVIESLKSLNKEDINIVFVSTSSIENCANITNLKDLCHTIIERENIGYDFGSYKIGIQLVEELDEDPSSLIITNDSVYGPLFPISNILKNSLNFDLYGITDSIDGTYHIQSYFIIYNHSILKSDKFWNFWKSVKLIDNKTKDFKLEIIKRYEIGGSQFFIDNGFKLGAEYAIDDLIKTECEDFLSSIKKARSTAGEFKKALQPTLNSVHYRWKSLLKAKCPYIKRELLALNPAFVDIDNWPHLISSLSDYPVEQIIDSVQRHLNSHDFLYTTITNKKVAKLLNVSGYVKLRCSDAFEEYRIKHKLPEFKEFIFDEEYYRDKYPDVDHVIKLRGVESGIFHFLMYGYNENRSFKLKPI